MKVTVKVAQSCLTLCDPMDYTVHRILQARMLEWVALPSPGNLPNPGIESRSPALQEDSLPAVPQGKPQIMCPIVKAKIEPTQAIGAECSRSQRRVGSVLFIFLVNLYGS